MFRGISTLLLLAGCLFGGSAARAATVQIRDAVGGETSFGVSTPPGGFYLLGTGSRPLGTYTGMQFVALPSGAFDFEADWDDDGNFEQLLTYCLEPIQAMQVGINPPDSTGLTYTIEPLSSVVNLTASERDYIERLWANAFADSLTSRVKAAAFQAMLWEFWVDGSFNLAAGNFVLDNTHAHTQQVIAQVATWANELFNLGNWTQSTPLNVLTHPSSQDILVPVPEPATMALMAMGALAFVRRRSM